MPETDFPDALIHIVDDDQGARDSLKFLLETAGHVVRAHAGARACLESIGPTSVGCVISDVRMPEMDGLELQRHLVANGVYLPLILITGQGDVPMAVSALKAGAVDFLEKPFDEAQLLSAVARALATCRERALAHATSRRTAERLARLTAREREVLDALVAGMASKEIARVLSVSPRTVEVHRARVMEKMAVRGVPELVHMMHTLTPQGPRERPARRRQLPTVRT